MGQVLQTAVDLLVDKRLGRVAAVAQLDEGLDTLIAQRHRRLYPLDQAHPLGDVGPEVGDGGELTGRGGPFVGRLGADLLDHFEHFDAHLEVAMVVGLVVVVVGQGGGELEHLAGRRRDQVGVELGDHGAGADLVDVTVSVEAVDFFAVEHAAHVDADAVAGVGLAVDDGRGREGVTHAVDLRVDLGLGGHR